MQQYETKWDITMLILTRKPGESLYIGDGIKITLLNIQGKQAKFGINVPENITVYREEIYNLVADDNEMAKHTSKENIETNMGNIEIETRLGLQKISEENIINFPKGLIGYEDQKSFTILPLGENSPYFLLQSTQKPDLGLIITDPYLFIDDYSVKISEFEQGLIQVEKPEEILVYSAVAIPHGKPEEATLNLSGPIFINYEKKMALQIPQDIKLSKVYITDCCKNKIS